MSNQNWNGENNRPKDSHSKIDFSQFMNLVLFHVKIEVIKKLSMK